MMANRSIAATLVVGGQQQRPASNEHRVCLPHRKERKNPLQRLRHHDETRGKRTAAAQKARRRPPRTSIITMLDAATAPKVLQRFEGTLHA